jgi:hypothetical protein
VCFIHTNTIRQQALCLIYKSTFEAWLIVPRKPFTSLGGGLSADAEALISIQRLTLRPVLQSRAPTLVNMKGKYRLDIYVNTNFL